MTLKKLAVMAALTAALGFAGATTAIAADEDTSGCSISSDGTEVCTGTTETDPSDDVVGIDPSGGCWTNADGVDVCAKGIMTMTGVDEVTDPTATDDPAPSNEPMPPAVCTDDNGTEVTCPEVMMYSNMPGNMDDMKRDISLTSSATNSFANLIPASGVIAALTLSLAGALYAKKLKK